MNTPTKAVEATSLTPNAEKKSESNKTAENNEGKGDEPQKTIEVNNPAPASVK